MLLATALCQPDAMSQTSLTRATAAASQCPQPHSAGCVSRSSTTRLTSVMVTGSPVTWAALNTATATRSSASAMRMAASVPPRSQQAALPHLPTRWQFDVLVRSAKRCLLAFAVAGGLINRDEVVAILAEISLQKFVGLFVPATVFVDHRDGVGDAHGLKVDHRAFGAVHPATGGFHH